MKSTISTYSFHSTASRSALHGSESIQRSGLRPKKSYNKVDKFSKEGIKSLSQPTDQRNENTKDQMKIETKPTKSILKKPLPTRTKPNRRSTSGRRTLAEKAGSKRKSLSELSRSKSLLSVISKVPTRSTSQRSLFRDVAFRNYPVGSGFTSQGSALSLFSTETKMSKNLQGPKKSQKKNTGIWGNNKFSLLNQIQSMEHDLNLLKPQSKEGSRVQAKSKELLNASVSIHLSDSEDEDMLEAKTRDSESKEPSTEEPAERSSLLQTFERSHFLQTFESLPSINDLLSTTTLEAVELPEEEADLEYEPSFDEASYESDESPTTISSLEEVESLIHVDAKSQLSTDLSFDLLSESIDEPTRDSNLVKESQLDISVRMKNIRRKTDVDFESSSMANDRPSLPSTDKIEAFLDDLLQQAVKSAIKPRMRQMLDIKKLVDELQQITVEYQNVLEENQRLDKITSEYFIRRKEFAYVETDGDNPMIHRSRLTEAINVLDFNLKRERETKLMTDNQLEELRNQAKTEKSLDVQKIEHFETKVRESLLKNGFNRLTFVIDKLFREMNEVRDEVSKSRMKISSIKHQLATMEIQMADQGIDVVKYLSNQLVTHTLTEKIYERNAELDRLKDRVTHDLHTITHLKEKASFNQVLLQDLRDKLKLKRQRQKKLRDLLHTEMLRRNRLRKETENVRSGCLILYPKLLRDYDATEDHLWAKQKVIQTLKSEHNRLERKLLQVEAEIAAINRTVP